MTAIDPPLLQTRNLAKRYPVRDGRDRGVVNAVVGVDLTVMRGETLGLVGESGCGKTTLGRMLVRLLDPSEGEIRLKGVDIAHMRGRRASAFRRQAQMVFQDPYSSLDPRMSVEAIVAEPLAIQRIGTRAERAERVVELLSSVGIAPDMRGRRPAAFSGGQRQRIGIARALALEPELLVLDEPVSALDVSIQAQVLNLLASVQARRGLTYVFISHDLGVVRHICDAVAVMYLGRIVEIGAAEAIFEAPAHPYTQALLSAVPKVEGAKSRRIVLAGEPPDARSPPSGCAFRTRCWRARDICATDVPALVARPGVSHPAACHFAEAGTDG